MRLLWAFILLPPQEDRLRLEGAPFLVFGETAEVRLESPLKDAVPVWRVADAASSVETFPAFNPGNRTVRGVDRLQVRSLGKTEGDVLLTVALERRGVRVAQAEHRIRVGPALRVRAWCRIVEHPSGGTRRGAFFRDDDARRELQETVNRHLRPLGIEVSLEPGRAVNAPDPWFDAEGRFRPVALKDGEKAHSLTLKELLKNDQPGGLNLYLVRDCHWTTVEEGFRKVITEHSLAGVGMKDGQVVLDDSADALSLAHELGHAFSLDDLKEKADRGRLMYSIRSERMGTAFTRTEMLDARTRAQLHLKQHRAVRRSGAPIP